MNTNIAVIVLDSLRNDHFTKQFDWLSGSEFTNVYSTSHWTIPSHASLLTGKYGGEVGVHAKSPSLDHPTETITEQLSEAGYKTRMWSSNANLTCWDGWDRGFDEFIGPTQLNPADEYYVNWPAFARKHDCGPTKKISKAVWHCILSEHPTVPALREGYRFWRRSREEGGTKSVIKRSKSTNFSEQEFLLINLMEAHTPYRTPDSSDSVSVVTGDAFANTVDDPDYVRQAYRYSVRYLDENVKELYQVLKPEFDFIIIVGDHGEMLGEHGMWNHGYGLYPELVQVPLVISGEQVDDEVNNDLVSLLDLHRTIGQMAGIDVESRGFDLLDSPKERPILTEYHGFRPGHKKQFERKGVPDPDHVYEEHDTPLYGVALPEGYAYQTHSEGLRTEDDLDLETARSELEAIRETIEERETEDFDQELDEETKQQLRDLGYA